LRRAATGRATRGRITDLGLESDDLDDGGATTAASQGANVLPWPGGTEVLAELDAFAARGRRGGV
jgi:hypothetical protein